MNPLLILVGADKGGVGKTTFCRALLQYVPISKLHPVVYDTEPNGHNLRRYHNEARSIDAENINDQMTLFDRMPPVTLVDIKAGLLTPMLKSMNDLELLTNSKEIRLVIFHVLGNSISSLEEIKETSDQLAGRADHILVRNHISGSQNFFDFSKEATERYFSHGITDIIDVPNLEARAQSEVDLYAKPYTDYLQNKDNSLIVRKYLQKWMNDVFAQLDKLGLDRRLQ